MSAEEDFAVLADDYLDDLARRHPDAATGLGDHRFDDRLPDLSGAALAAERRALDGFAARLAAIGTMPLTAELRVDATMLSESIARRIFELDELREHTWNPLLANPGSAIYDLLARDFAPLPDRLASAAGRLAEIPAVLEAARASLGAMPKVHIETAITQFSGTINLVTNEIDAALRKAGGPAVVHAARPAALEALGAHLDWLSAELARPSAGDFADPRIGSERFARKLSLTLSAAADPDAILARAEADLDRITGEITEVAASLGGTPREVLDRLAADAPEESSATTTWSRCMTTRSRSSTCRRSTAASRSPTATHRGRWRPRRWPRSSRSPRCPATGRRSGRPLSTASTTGTWCTT